MLTITRTEKIIAEYGFAQIGVFPTEKDHNGEFFNYTIGMTDKDLPEIITTGLKYHQAAELINIACLTMMKEGAYKDKELCNKIIAGFNVRFRDVTNSETIRKYATGAFNRAEGKEQDITILQMLWPDAEGCFPGDPDFDKGFSHQILL